MCSKGLLSLGLSFQRSSPINNRETTHFFEDVSSPSVKVEKGLLNNLVPKLKNFLMNERCHHQWMQAKLRSIVVAKYVPNLTSK